MEVVLLLVFVSAVLVSCSLFALLASLRQNDQDHIDRLALAPLVDDEGAE